MTYQEFKFAVIAEAKALGLTEYEIYYQAEESTSVSTFRHEINEFTGCVEGGLCFRCIAGGKMGYASTEALTAQEAKRIVAAAIDNAMSLEAEDPVFLVDGGQTYTDPKREAYTLPNTETLIAKTLEAHEALYAADPKVVDGSVSRGYSIHTELAIYNSRGLDLQNSNDMTAIMVGAVVSDGTEMTNDYQFKVGELSKVDTAALSKKAVDTALSKIGGDVPDTGIYPVIFNPEAMSDLLSTFSVIFSSERAQKGLSKLAGMEGAVIASEAVTLIDDPFHKDNPVPCPFDAEGSPTYTKNVIEKGELKTLLYNLKTAAKAGKTTTGNASKAGYTASVAVRPFTMYLAPGDASEDALLQRAGKAVYIDSLAGLHAGADVVTGDFSLQSAGYLVEDGKKTTHIKSFTVAGNFFDLLKNIEAVANNFEIPVALSSTAFGSPSVLVSSLSIAGK